MSLPASTPRLSIGLPVYNGENYLAAAIGGILDQNYSDFELIISDNASTDGTEEICRVFADVDSRIRYVRNTENVGAAANYNQTLDLAGGEYFKWASHDDVCLSGFLENCVATLDARPEVVLCHSRSQGIGERGEIKGVYGEELSFDAGTPAARLWQVISTPHVCIAIFGVMRKDLLLRTIRHGDWVGADRNLLAELSLHGPIVVLPQFLFQRREHPEASIHKFVDESERLAWFDPALKGVVSYPTWRRLQEYLKAVSAAPLSLSDKALCFFQLIKWVGARHHTGPFNAKKMLQELLPKAKRQAY